MRINNMSSYNETTPTYMPYYIATIVIAIIIGYFLIIGGKLLRALFILIWDYWWATILIVLALIFFRYKMRVK